jgi:hypothetical protein
MRSVYEQSPEVTKPWNPRDRHGLLTPGTLKYAHHIPTLTPGCARNKGNMSNLTEDSIVLLKA